MHTKFIGEFLMPGFDSCRHFGPLFLRLKMANLLIFLITDPDAFRYFPKTCRHANLNIIIDMIGNTCYLNRHVRPHHLPP